MLHKRFTAQRSNQSSDDEEFSGATPPRTASTASLVESGKSEQRYNYNIYSDNNGSDIKQRQQQQPQLQRHKFSHYNQKTPAAITAAMESTPTLAAVGQRQQKQPNVTANSNYPAAFTKKHDYSKLRYPGAITRQTNPTVLPVRPKREKIQTLDSGDQVTTGWASIRRIRRPQLWLPFRWGANGIARESDMLADQLQNQQQQRSKRNIWAECKEFFIEFLQDLSMHGFRYLAVVGLSIVERILWFAFICVALFGIISLSRRTWERFQNSPMVISMDRNKLVWNTSFPSLTVCPHKRIDEAKVEEYILLHPENFPTEEDKEDFGDFVLKLASLSYENIETLPTNKSFGIPGSKYLDMLYELKWNFEPEMSSGAAVKMYIYETLTEFGICHSVNSLVARYNSYDYWKSNDWNLLDHGDRVTVHPLDGEIYAQIINLSTAYDVYFHGSGDIPSISKQRYTFPERDYTTVELIALEIYTAEAAREFTPKQRKCRFRYESEELLTTPIYSFGFCLAECRMFFALKVCGCIPHFYRSRLINGKELPVCDITGLSCLADIKKELISLKSEKYKIDCKCLANCDDSNFFVQTYRSRVWFLGANLQWGIIDYPKMQLRRDVLFSFADVLVYIGGLAGFFLGCSALSFTEMIYYLTARFVRRIFFS